MSKFKFSVLIFVFASCPSLIFAQSATPTPQRRQINQMENVRAPENVDRSTVYNRRSFENYPAKYRVSSKALKKTQLTDEEKELYKSSRKNKGLKVLKIFVAPPCAENRAINVEDSACAEVYDFIPVSFYSFFDEEYGEIFSDFRILKDRLVAGDGQYLHGFLMDVGEVEIGNLEKNSPQVKLLTDYEIAKTVEEADKQKLDLEKGINLQNQTLSSQKKLIPNHTYILRIVAYTEPDENVTLYNHDSVFVFKVDKLSDDNTAIILWKKLSGKMAPKLKKNK